MAYRAVSKGQRGLDGVRSAIKTEHVFL